MYIFSFVVASRYALPMSAPQTSMLLSVHLLLDELCGVHHALTGFCTSPKSFWSCTHVNSCQQYKLHINLHILLIILCKATLNIQESRKSNKYIKSYKQYNFNYFVKLVYYCLNLK